MILKDLLCITWAGKNTRNDGRKQSTKHAQKCSLGQ